MKRKQFITRFALLGVLLVLAFCLWVGTLVNGNKPVNVFLFMLPLIAIVIALRITKEKYDINGFFSRRQAVEFYKACMRAGIQKIDAAGEPQWRSVYTMTVGALPFADVQENTKQAKRVFACGKEYIERKMKNK